MFFDDFFLYVGIEPAVSQHFDFMLIRRIGFFRFGGGWDIRCLQYFRHMLEVRVVHDVRQCVKTDIAEAKIGMPVFGGTPLIFAVIDMEDGNLVFSQEAVELLDHTVKIMDDVITAVVGMAGIEADAQLVAAGDSIVDARQFFKALPKFGSFSGHGFKGYEEIRIPGEDFVEALDHLADPGVCPCSYVGDRVQDEDILR